MYHALGIALGILHKERFNVKNTHICDVPGMSSLAKLVITAGGCEFSYVYKVNKRAGGCDFSHVYKVNKRY